MLSQSENQEVIKITYDTVAPTVAQVLQFPTSEAYEFISLNSRITAAGAIVLSGLSVRNESGVAIANCGRIPWQFAGTSIELAQGQTPDPSLTSLFAAMNIGGFIPSGLHVYNGWSVRWGDFIGTPGVIFETEMLFTQAILDA